MTFRSMFSPCLEFDAIESPYQRQAARAAPRPATICESSRLIWSGARAHHRPQTRRRKNNGVTTKRMNEPRGPLLTLPVHEALLRARDAGAPVLDCTLDLGRTTSRVETGTEHWHWNGRAYAYDESCQDRTIYSWDEDRYAPAARFANSLIKLVQIGRAHV